MAHFEVTSTSRGRTYIVATTRRENGAIAERDIAIDSEYRNKAKRGRTVQGADPRDPNAVVVAYVGDGTSPVIYTTFTYRRVPPYVPEPTVDTDLTDVLLASLIAYQ